MCRSCSLDPCWRLWRLCLVFETDMRLILLFFDDDNVLCIVESFFYGKVDGRIMRGLYVFYEVLAVTQRVVSPWPLLDVCSAPIFPTGCGDLSRCSWTCEHYARTEEPTRGQGKPSNQIISAVSMMTREALARTARDSSDICRVITIAEYCCTAGTNRLQQVAVTSIWILQGVCRMTCSSLRYGEGRLA
jgi:hypothetical protein